jgi:hypothetical protein
VIYKVEANATLKLIETSRMTTAHISWCHICSKGEVAFTSSEDRLQIYRDCKSITIEKVGKISDVIFTKEAILATNSTGQLHIIDPQILEVSKTLNLPGVSQEP